MQDDQVPEPIYKIVGQDEWSEAQRTGVYSGSEHDKRDGFIHFSTRTQLSDTAKKHFAGRDNLLLLEVEPTDFQPGFLRYEPSRGGQLFPHLYGPLNVSEVRSVKPFFVPQ